MIVHENGCTSTSLQPLQSHIHATFVSRLFPDTSLLVGHLPPIHGHALILSRSLLLCNILLQNRQGPGHTIHIPCNDRQVTSEAVHVAVEYLYTTQNPSDDLSEIILPIMAACSLLGIYTDELATWIDKIVQAKYVSSSWIHYLIEFLALEETNNLGPYPVFTSCLYDKVLNFLIFTAPNIGLTTGNTDLIDLYALLGFPLLKKVLEHKDLPVSSNHIRYRFDKEVIARRHALRPANLPVLTEELVVLVFGGANEKAVEIICRPLKKRGIWKVKK